MNSEHNFITPTVNYTPPLKDMEFQLKTFGYEDVAALEDYEDYED